MDAAARRCKRMKEGETEPVYWRGVADIGLDERNNIGYNLIGGSEKLNFNGWVTREATDEDSCCIMRFDLKYYWYDTTNRNFNFITDFYEGGLAELLGAQPYDYVIEWEGISIYSDCSKVAPSGWPMDKGLIEGLWEEVDANRCRR